MIAKILTLALLTSLSAHGLSISCTENDALGTREQLDQAYEKAEIVFLANAVLDQDAGPTRWKYSVITPVLKGDVEPEGYLNSGEGVCDFVEATVNGVYLVFWDMPNEPITNRNTVLVVFGEPKIAEEWVLNWAQSKTHNK
jgi:hypothetical protein